MILDWQPVRGLSVFYLSVEKKEPGREKAEKAASVTIERPFLLITVDFKAEGPYSAFPYEKVGKEPKFGHAWNSEEN